MSGSDGRARIVAVVAAIPAGQVRGYGQVALAAGLPGRARWVARILAEHDGPALPWHRVVRSDGRIAFAPGSAQWREQVARLQGEGVTVKSGRVKLANASVSDVDRAIWGPE